MGRTELCPSVILKRESSPPEDRRARIHIMEWTDKQNSDILVATTVQANKSTT